MIKITGDQWRGGSEAAGGQPYQWRPPPVMLFCLLVWDACHDVGTTCNDRWSLSNKFGLGRHKPRSSSLVKSWWSSRGLATWKLQRICILWYLNPGLLLPNNTWMVMHPFIYIAVKSHRKIPKVQNSQVFIRKKMCIFYSSSWIIFLKFKRQAI